MPDKSDDNFSHIMGDAGDSLKRQQDRSASAPCSPEVKEGRFSTLPLGGLGDDYSARAKEVIESLRNQGNPGGGAGTTIAEAAPITEITSENYQKAFLEQRARERLQAQNNAAVPSGGPARQDEAAKAAAAKAAADKAAFEKKQNDDMRFRARDLQNQINWWNQQRGMGQYEEPIINATIYKLQNELNGIPAAFWT